MSVHRTVLLTIAALAIAQVPARATGNPAGGVVVASVSAPETAEQTLAPLAFVAFCRRNPRECVPGADQVPALTPARRAQLEDVNRRVNAMITSIDIEDESEWRIAPRSGNCNDYAVTKRHLLLSLGWPTSSLLLARVRTLAPMVDHLILIVRTQEDSFVLDNLKTEVRPKQEKAYHWLKRQSSADPRIWVWGS